MPFQLKREKAIKKKQMATDRDTCTVEQKAGGNIVMTLSTGAYEIVKGTFLELFHQHHPGKTKVTVKEDENEAIIQHTITIFKDQTKQDKLYTINMYHTTSKILTNGNNPKLCVEHILKILTEIDNAEIQILNDQIREKCNAASANQTGTHYHGNPVDGVSDSRMTNTTTNCTNNAIAILEEESPNRDQEINEDSVVLCPCCTRPAQQRSIECTMCSQWIHYDCEGLTEELVREHEEDENKIFTCNLCSALNENQGETENNNENTDVLVTREHAATNMQLALPAPGNQQQENADAIQPATISNDNGTVHRNRIPQIQQNAEPAYTVNNNTSLTPPTSNTTTITTLLAIEATPEQTNSPSINPNQSKLVAQLCNTTCTADNPPVLHNTNTEKARNTTQEQLAPPKATTQNTKPVEKTNGGTDTKTTKKRQKKQDNFELSDTEKQLAFCKSEIIRLENCCKEYQNTIQILKLRLATTLPENETTNTTKQATYSRERQVPHSESSLDIRLTALEAQMGLMKEKLEINNMLQDIREERRQMNVPAANKCHCIEPQSPKPQTSVRTPGTSTANQGAVTEDEGDCERYTQHFLSHGRASTNTHHQTTQLLLQRNQGQPLFIQQAYTPQMISHTALQRTVHVPQHQQPTQYLWPPNIHHPPPLQQHTNPAYYPHPTTATNHATQQQTAMPPPPPKQPQTNPENFPHPPMTVPGYTTHHPTPIHHPPIQQKQTHSTNYPLPPMTVPNYTTQHQTIMQHQPSLQKQTHPANYSHPPTTVPNHATQHPIAMHHPPTQRKQTHLTNYPHPSMTAPNYTIQQPKTMTHPPPPQQLPNPATQAHTTMTSLNYTTQQTQQSGKTHYAPPQTAPAQAQQTHQTRKQPTTQYP